MIKARAAALLKSHGVFLLLALLLLLIREGMILSEMWAVKDGGDLPEALISGNFAFDVLDRQWRGWDTYLYIRRGNLGNEIMVGIAAIPLYLLFGESLFVLSQVQILSSLTILLTLYIFCQKHFGAGAALIASLFMVCLPSGVQRFLLYPDYLYFDNALYTLLAFLFFLQMRQSATERKRLLSATLLGLTLATGFFHTEMHILTIGCVLLFWILRDRFFFVRREFLVFLLALLIGFLPSLYFGFDSYLQFFILLFSGSFYYSYDAGLVPPTYDTTLRLMSVAFWPLRNLTFGIIPPPLISVVGLAVLLAIAWWMRIQRKFTTAFGLLWVFALGFMAMTLAFKGQVGYYFHPLLIPVSILLAVPLAHFRTTRVRGTAQYQLFSLLLCAVGGANLFSIIGEFQPARMRETLREQLRVNGCCFYWPEGYRPPGGLKTPTSSRVEAFAAAWRFAEATPPPGVPVKRIFVSRTRQPCFPLTSPESYLAYGKDASFAGIERLAQEIHERVPPDSKEYAYAGLAVYYVNDNWLKDLLREFRSGLIERVIPPDYRRMFYAELARKIVNRSPHDPAWLAKLAATFPEPQRAWILASAGELR